MTEILTKHTGILPPLNPIGKISNPTAAVTCQNSNKISKHLQKFLFLPYLDICKKIVIITVMRVLIIILTLISAITLIPASRAEGPIEKVQLEMKGYDEIILPAGSFIPVLSTQEISTETCPEGYKVKFISTSDLFMYETNIIPRETVFYGYIEKINEPVVGTNAAMKIKITKLIMPDGFEIPIQGYIYSSNNNIIGGGLTPPAEWVKMPHYQAKFQGIAWNHRAATLQMRPGGKRSMGVHTKIPAGDQQIIILTASTPITHTITE